MSRSNLTRHGNGEWELRRWLAAQEVELTVKPGRDEGDPAQLSAMQGVTRVRVFLGVASYLRAREAALAAGYDVAGWEARNWFADELEHHWGVQIRGTLRAMRRELKAIEALVELD